MRVSRTRTSRRSSRAGCTSISSSASRILPSSATGSSAHTSGPRRHMSIHVALNHVTRYRYDRPVQLSPQVIRLRPAPHARTPVHAYSMRGTPAKHFVNWQQDPQSNYLARVVFPDKTREFQIEVDLVAEMSVINPFDFFLEPSADRIPFRYDVSQVRELGPYLVKMPPTPLFSEYLDSIPRAPRQSVEFLVELNRQLAKDIKYLIRMEAGVQ